MKRKSVGALLPLLHRERPLGARQQEAVDAFVAKANKAFRKSKRQKRKATEAMRLAPIIKRD